MKNQKTCNQVNKDAPLDLHSKSKQGGTHDQVLRFYLKTYGCQMNASDSEKVRADLFSLGCSQAHEPDNADITVINTCAVRDHAEKRALSHIGRLRKWKKEREGRKIIVVGCVPERIGKELKRDFPEIDMIIGAKSLNNFREKAAGLLGDGIKKGNEPVSSSKIHTEKSGYVSIMTGCDNYCSYCIVPYVRGNETSMETDKIIDEIETLSSSGQKKIMLLGQNVNSYNGYYGRFSKQVDFKGLLEIILDLGIVENISFMTSHPKDMKRELLDLICSSDIFDKMIHFPLQSGSNRILGLMNRSYTREDYKNIVEYLRSKDPSFRISTDIIVGFPSETEDDFNDTLDMMREMEFCNIYAFKYSPREGTKAYGFPDDVPRSLKETRHARILELQKITAKKQKCIS